MKRFPLFFVTYITYIILTFLINTLINKPIDLTDLLIGSLAAAIGFSLVFR